MRISRPDLYRYLLAAFLILLAGLWFWLVDREGQGYGYTCSGDDLSCNLASAAYRDSSLPIEQRVDDLLNRMTTEEKIGQLSLIDRRSLEDPEDIARYGIGAVLSGSGAHPENNTAQGWQDMIRGYQEQAAKTRLKIPLLYGVDAIHGHANVPGATVFPHQIGLGAANDPELVRRIGQATAEEMTATGIYWNFSPSLDIAKDRRWGRVYETFGGYGDRTDKLAAAAVSGFQGASSSPFALATAKHYVGGGAATWGTSRNEDYQIDQGNTELSELRLRLEHLPPFKAAVEAGVWSVMAGLNSWNGEDITSHRYLLTEVLKDELGFGGFVVSDWYGVYEIPGNDYQNTATAFNSGVDLVMLPYDFKKFAADMKQAVDNGKIPAGRLNDAVRRILLAKFAAGLFDRPAPTAADLAAIGSQEHRALAREAVRKSLVRLKDSNRTLPLNKESALIIVAGSAADNTGRQSGGWTIEWQGVDGNVLPGATSILAGIRQTVSPRSDVRYDRDGNFNLSRAADIGIAVVGEKPYAEGQGDNADPRLSDEDLAVIERVRRASRRLVVVIVSGRPLTIRPASRNWPTIVAAWLPGSEGQGVADVLFGDYPFTGTLPMPWEI